MTVALPVAQRRWTATGLTVAAVWLGMLLGVSFLATPAKFMAPSLTLPVALDVGRHTFAVFNKAEWLLSALLIGALLIGGRTRLGTAAVAAAILLVAMETFWLLPLLDQRVGAIIAGQPPAPSGLHNLYIALELAKLLVLALAVVAMAGRLAGSSSSHAVKS